MLTCVAACAFGLTGLVARELRALGFAPKPEGDFVRFQADAAGLARACLWLRTADRVQVLVGEFPAGSYDALFDGLRALPWRDYVPRNARLPVSARCVRAVLMSPADCQAVGKRALVEALGGGRLPETGPRFGVELSLRGEQCRVLLDACGAGLHKRGYRQLTGPAPVKETLAAAILSFSGWRPELPLLDPMCGTGTFLIEAALMAGNRAPGLERGFDAESWPIAGAAPFQAAREEARAALRPGETLLQGTDIDGNALAMARESARRAGVTGIRFQQADVSQAARSREPGMLVTNPPYGKRLLEERNLQPLYRKLGGLWAALPGYSAHVFTAYPDFERYFGRRAASTQKLYNGPLLCRLYHYGADAPRPRTKAVK